MCSLHDILLQAAQSFFRGLKDIIVFAYSKTEIIFSNVCVLVRIELCWRNCSHSNLVDKEPAKLEVPGAVGHMRREFVVLWELDRRHICKNEVATFGVRVLMPRVSTTNEKQCHRNHEHTGIPSSLKALQKRSIFCFISVRLSSQNPTLSACSKATAAASCRGDTLL